VCVLSARLSLELSEYKVLPTWWGDSWVNQVVQGASEVLESKWLTCNRLQPSGLVWSGEDTLCGGCGDPLPKGRSSLVEAASRWPRELGECQSGEPLWRVKWCSWERLGDREAILLCEWFNNVDYGWLSAYRYHKINRVSRDCFLSSLFTFPHYSLAILACLYFTSVISC
jgi:hypothetical protein